MIEPSAHQRTNATSEEVRPSDQPLLDLLQLVADLLRRYCVALPLWGSYGSAVCETIKQAELRNNNAEIMRRVAAGESFTVTVHGQPVADLVPHQRLSRGRRRLVPASEFDAALAALPPLDVEQWKRDLQEADDVFGDDQPTDPLG
jgi:prevent-host-death family protein